MFLVIDYKQILKCSIERYCRKYRRAGEQAPDSENVWSLFTHKTERLHGYVEMMREHLLQIREMYQTQVDIEQNRIVTV